MPAPSAASDRFRRALGAAALALAVAIVFQPALHGGWVWDDISEITLNPTLRDAAGLRRIWFAPPGPDYLPLKSTVLWLEWHLWGARTTGYHVATMAFHWAGCLLVWRLLRRLGVRLAWLGGLLFAVHPVAVESVAWISEQKNTLSLPLLLLAMDAYLTYDQSRRAPPYLRSLGFFLAAMLAKAAVVMFPAVILLHAWWRRGAIARRDLAASVPFFAVSAVLGAAAIWFQQHAAIAGAHLAVGGPWSRAAGAGLAIAFYFSKCVLPVGLAPIYPGWPVDPPSPAQFLPWPALALVLGWLWSKQRSWGRPALLGLGFFLINLLPVLGFVPMSFMRLAPVSDHFAYVSLVGIAGLAAAACGRAYARMAPGWRPWAAAGLGVVLGSLMAAGRAGAREFRDGETLWAAAVAGDPASAPAHYNLANALVLSGRVPEALPEFAAAIRLRPGFAEARSNFGDALARLGRTTEAEEQYEAALRAEPGLTLTRDKLGDLLLAQDRLAEAVGQYEAAVAADPASAAAQGDLAYALAWSGRLDEAADRYAAALRLDPANADIWDERGTVLAALGRTPEAIRHFERALQLRPDDAEAHNNLGLALAREGRLAEAIPHFEEALRLRPDFPQARRNLEQARRAEKGGGP